MKLRYAFKGYLILFNVFNSPDNKVKWMKYELERSWKEMLAI
jgi:hypothetical protein